MPQTLTLLQKPCLTTTTNTNEPISQQESSYFKIDTAQIFNLQDESEFVSPLDHSYQTILQENTPSKNDSGRQDENPIIYDDNTQIIAENEAIVPKRRFKSLYPTQHYDEKQKQCYRLIDQITGFKDPTQKEDIHLRVWEEGKKVYLFTGETLNSSVVIDAHAEYDPYKNDLITLTDDMPTITLLNPHDTILQPEFGWSTKNAYAAVSNKGIIAFCESAAEALNNPQQGYQRITGSPYPRTLRNYKLNKFDWSTEELALGPFANYREYVAYTIDQMTEYDDELPAPCDVYTIRKKNLIISTRELLQFAQKRDYSEIIYAFCRGAYNNEDETSYRPSKENKLLDSPLYKSWEDLEKLQ